MSEDRRDFSKLIAVVQQRIVGILGPWIVRRDDRGRGDQHLIETLEEHRMDDCEMTRMFMGRPPAGLRSSLQQRGGKIADKRYHELRSSLERVHHTRNCIHSNAAPEDSAARASYSARVVSRPVWYRPFR